MSAVGDGIRPPPESGVSSSPEKMTYNREDHSFILGDGSKVFVNEFSLDGKVIEKEGFTPEIQKLAADILGKMIDVKSDFTHAEATVQVSPEKTTATYKMGDATHDLTYIKPIHEKMRALMQSIRFSETPISTSPRSISTSPKESPKAPVLSRMTRLKNSVSSLFRGREPPPVTVPKADVNVLQREVNAELGKLEKEIWAVGRAYTTDPNVRGKKNKEALKRIPKELELVENEGKEIKALTKKLSAEETRLREQLPKLSQQEGQAKIKAHLEKFKNLCLWEAMNKNKKAALEIREELARGEILRMMALNRYNADFEPYVTQKVFDKKNELNDLLPKAPLSEEHEEEYEVKEREMHSEHVLRPMTGVDLPAGEEKPLHPSRLSDVAERVSSISHDVYTPD